MAGPIEGVIDVLKFLDVAIEAGASDLESLGPAASKKIALQLRGLGLIDQVTQTAIENNSYVGWVGLAFGALAVFSLMTPIGATADSIAVGATSLVGYAISEISTAAGYEVFGSFLASGVVETTNLIAAVANAVIQYYVSEGSQALLALADSAGAACGDLVRNLLVAAPKLYNNNITVSSVTVPTSSEEWNNPSGSVSYTIYTSQLTPTGNVVQVHQETQIPTVQGVVVDSSGKARLILNYGGPIGGNTGLSTILLDGGKIDPEVASPPYITVATDGSLVVGLPDSSGYAVILDYNTGTGIASLVFGPNGSTNGTQIISFDGNAFSGDTVDINNITSTSATAYVQIGADSVFNLISNGANSNISKTFLFGGAGGTLEITDSAGFTGIISGFASGGTIDLKGVSVTSAPIISGDVLTVQEVGGSTIFFQLDSSQSYSGYTVSFNDDGNNGTDIFLSAASATVTGSQTVTIDAPVTNPSTGQTTTYSASVVLTPANIQFPAIRTGDPLPAAVPVTVTFNGGNLDPNGGSVGITDDPPQTSANPSDFYIIADLSGIGQTNTSGTIDVRPYSDVSGDYSNETLPLTVSYDGSSTTVNVNVGLKVYAPAIPEFLVNGTQESVINFGIIHPGQMESMNVEIANVATGALTDSLSCNPGGVGSFVVQNGFSGIQAGNSGTVTLSMFGEVAGPVLVINSAPLFGLVSHDSDLPDQAISSVDCPLLLATVYNYAAPTLVNTETLSAATLVENGNNWILDLGTVSFDSPYIGANINIINATPSVEYSDTLSVIDTITLSPDGGFIQSLQNLTGQYAMGGGGGIELGDFIPDAYSENSLGTHTETIVLHLISSNSAGSTALPDITLTITDNVVASCYAAGTRITSARGAIPIEHLVVGDQVRTRTGVLAPVKWLGYRAVDCRRHPKPVDVWPVRVRPGAFGKCRPHTDLWLSPDHAVFIDGVLIPIRYLMNGKTIVQEPHDVVTYWHVELDWHDVILAEGLPCESYLDTGNRGAFANGGPFVQMHPDFALRIWEAEACAKLVLDGAELEAARSFVLERAAALGHATTRNPDLRLIAAGRELRPEIHGRLHRFRVPAVACGVRLVSRSAVPAEVRDDGTDHRQLGVAVSRIRYGGQAIPLTDLRLGTGWYDVEHGGDDVVWRWTDGEAGLALPGGQVLEIEVAMTERYWLDDQPAAVRTRSAVAA